MSNTMDDTFCKKMRRATRDIHAISDGLVNAKLAFAFSDNRVWADGLLVFYEIFRYLEGAMVRLKNTKVGLLGLSCPRRTEAFERDLKFYLGEGWMKNYTPRVSVIKYLMRLREIEDTDPTLLIAYIYHLYMGLLSGGLILRKKRQLVQKLLPFESVDSGGNNITDFESHDVSQLKQDLRNTMNEIADTMDEDTKNKLIEESRTVYALNNEIIRSVQGAGTVVIKKIIYFIAVLVFLIFVIFVLFN